MLLVIDLEWDLTAGLQHPWCQHRSLHSQPLYYRYRRHYYLHWCRMYSLSRVQNLTTSCYPRKSRALALPSLTSDENLMTWNSNLNFGEVIFRGKTSASSSQLITSAGLCHLLTQQNDSRRAGSQPDLPRTETQTTTRHQYFSDISYLLAQWRDWLYHSRGGVFTEPHTVRIAEERCQSEKLRDRLSLTWS